MKKIIKIDGLGNVQIHTEHHIKIATLLNSNFIVSSHGATVEEAIANLKANYQKVLNSIQDSD